MGEEALVLNDSSVHVYEVESAVGAGVRVHGAEAFVGACEELFSRFAVGAGDQSVLFGEEKAFDQITGWFGDERVAEELFRKEV